MGNDYSGCYHMLICEECSLEKKRNGKRNEILKESIEIRAARTMHAQKHVCKG